jgi:TRAP transporter TAXI family solute receptor
MGTAVSPVAEFKIVTASPRGTYIEIGRDLARFVAPGANVSMEVLSSLGSSENVRRLRYEPGVRLALVQSDVYQAFLDEADAGNREAEALIRPLRVVMPLYNEEIYFIARADAPIEFVHEIRDAKMNIGPLTSGTALSAATLYRLMFDRQIPEGNATYLTNEDALVKLISDRTLDVVVVVAGQPARLLTEMKPEARQFIKLLKFDPEQPASKAALRTYFEATIRAANYPNLLPQDIPGVAVKAYLATYDYKINYNVDQMARFARSLCQNFNALQSAGHPKWREVQLSLPELGANWKYYAPTERELRRCIANRASGSYPQAPLRRACSQQERILGLCQ